MSADDVRNGDCDDLLEPVARVVAGIAQLRWAGIRPRPPHGAVVYVSFDDSRLAGDIMEQVWELSARLRTNVRDDVFLDLVANRHVPDLIDGQPDITTLVRR